MVKETKIIMGMPITAAIKDKHATAQILQGIFAYFQYVDEKFSTYKPGSEISRINRKEILPENYSADMQTVFALAETTKQETNGYFDIKQPNGQLDPSGLVKGWAIWRAGQKLEQQGFKNFFIEAGGDIQAKSSGEPWAVGIKNPFNEKEIIKILAIKNGGIATSGSYARGEHIYNPLKPGQKLTEVISVSVVADNVYEADRFATAAFAMGKAGINFIEQRPGLEGYQIDAAGIAIMTKRFNKYLKND